MQIPRLPGNTCRFANRLPFLLVRDPFERLPETVALLLDPAFVAHQEEKLPSFHSRASLFCSLGVQFASTINQNGPPNPGVSLTTLRRHSEYDSLLTSSPPSGQAP